MSQQHIVHISDKAAVAGMVGGHMGAGAVLGRFITLFLLESSKIRNHLLR